MGQTDIIVDREADAWWYRNKDKLPVQDDPVLRLIENSKIQFDSVLEVGCANGWRLAELQKRRPITAVGCDLSIAALDDGRKRFPDLRFYYSSANRLWRVSGRFDLVIMGFMLYLADREDLFPITAESNRLLEDGGHLIIYDFACDEDLCYSVPYKHDPKIKTYKMPYWRLWTGNPAYRLIGMDVGPETAVWLLKKDLSIWQ